MKRTWFVLLALLLVASMLVAACGPDATEPPAEEPTEATEAEPTEATEPEPEPEPTDAVEEPEEPEPEGEADKSGGTFRYNYFRPAGRFGDPLNIRHSDHHYGTLALQKLVQPDEGQAGAYTGVLAESWELADDKSSYTFKLREGVTFHDGTPFNAEAAKWNLDRAMGAGRPQFSAVESFEVVDEYTLKANLKQWTNLVLGDFGSDLGFMISPTAYEENGGEEWANTHPVGTGPWKYVEHTPNVSIAFEKFDDYWIEGLPHIDRLEVLHIPDSMTQMAALQAGEIHAIYSLDAVSGSELTAMGGYDIYTEGAPNILVTMNTTDPGSAWSDKRMREAFEYAVDKQAITDALGYGFQAPIYEVIHSISEVADAGTTPREYDPDKARELMAEAGYADGIDITAIVNADGPQDANVALQAMLADVGINIELNPVTGAAINQMAFEPLPGSDIRLDAMRGGPANPLNGVVEGLAETSIYFPGVSRPEGFQDLVEEALLLEDPAEVIDMVAQMEKLAYEDVMLVPLWSGSFIAASSPDIKDVFFFSAGGPNPRYEYAFLGEGAAELGAPPDFEPAKPPGPPPPPKEEGEGEKPPPEGEELEVSAEPLRIGTLVSLEFPLGVDMQKELDALVPVLNEQGGIRVGDMLYPIEIILYDTKLNPETGRAGAERLVYEDEVDFILGDETTDAWLSVTEAEDVLVVAMSPSPGVFDPQYNRVFQAGKINSDAGAMWGWLADNHPEFKTVVAMFPDDGKGQAEAGMLQQIADAYGYDLLDVIFYEPGTSDFSTYATRLATLDPDLYTTAAGGPVQDAMSMRAMREAGWDGQIFLKTTLSPQKMSEIIDLSLVEGTIAGMAGTTVPEPPPIAQELIDAYTEAYGAWDAPEVLHVLTFYVLKAAIEAAGSLDVDDVSAALLGGLAFDSPAGAGIMAARPDLGNERAIDTIYETTIGQIVNGEAVVIGTVPIEKVIEYNNVLRGLE